MAPTALFRCDAGLEIGTGHVVRCVALAEELTRRGWTCVIVALPGSSRAVASFAPSAIELIETENADDPATLRGLFPDGCDLLVIDSYRLGLEFEQATEGFASRRLVIDDLPTRAHHAELLLDCTLDRSRSEYAEHLDKATRQLLGPSYALLRPAFAAARREALARRNTSQTIKSVLVALGGAPSPGVLCKVINGILASRIEATIHVVGAPTAPETVAGRTRLVFHQPTPAIHDLMRDCDAAIGAGGGSAWERCCLGLPSLVIQLADNQRNVASSLAVGGAAIDLGRVETLAPESIATVLRALDMNPAQRVMMATRSALVCDGLGTRRVAGVLAPPLTRNGEPVTLRPVVREDAVLLFDWQQMPEMRSYSNDPRPPDWNHHLNWLEGRLADPLAGPFSVIECDGRPAGVLRFDRSIPERLGLPTDRIAEAYLLSIMVDLRQQGRRIAQAALAAGRDLLPDSQFYAEVHEDNAASRRLFERAQYTVLKPGIYLSEPRAGNT